MENTVAVIMPAYNAEKFIEEAVKSVQAQTFKNWELLVVDDGSTDNTASIIRKLAAQDPRIKYFSQNRGKQGKARNLGIANSSGNYITFLDADDLWSHTKLIEQLEIMKGRPDIDLVFTQGYNLFDNGHVTEANIEVKEWDWAQDGDLLTSANQIPVLSVMVRRKAVEAVNCFSEISEIQNAEDYHLWLKLLKAGKFLSIGTRSFYYRLHPQQATYESNNTAGPIAACLTDLVLSGVLSNKNSVVRERMKWLLFQIPDITQYFKMLVVVFPAKKSILSGLLLLNRFFPVTLTKKLAFHLL